MGRLARLGPKSRCDHHPDAAKRQGCSVGVIPSWFLESRCATAPVGLGTGGLGSAGVGVSGECPAALVQEGVVVAAHVLSAE